jgi:hypothetical protein
MLKKSKKQMSSPAEAAAEKRTKLVTSAITAN